jgi:uncharacterized MnhB-related membrane protein
MHVITKKNKKGLTGNTVVDTIIYVVFFILALAAVIYLTRRLTLDGAIIINKGFLGVAWTKKGS